MASLNIPNDIVDGAAVEAVDHQQNYDEIETFVNGSVIHVDGSTAMAGPLLLDAVATAPLGAVPLVQMEDADTVVADSVVAAVATASADATSKADAAEAAAVVTANAYTDSVKVETGFAADTVVTGRTTTVNPQTALTTGNIVNSKSGYYVATCTLDVVVNTLTTGAVGAFVAELKIDGIVQPQQIIWHPQNATLGDRMTLSRTWIVANPADTAAFVVTVEQATTPGSYRVEGEHCVLSVLFVG